MFDKLMRDDREIFEHFTHDASVLPTDFYPMWQRQFSRQKQRIKKAGWYQSMSPPAQHRAMKKRIEQEGPLSTKAFDTKIKGKKEMWSRPPHKLALDYMWYAGELATSHRDKFTKFYDLTDRVIPESARTTSHSDSDQVEWLCLEALKRLKFANSGEIKRFWDAVDTAEAKRWIDDNASKLVEVEIQAADRSRFVAHALPSIEDDLQTVTEPGERIRLLNPFDPVIRDRKRLERIFGFDYRIEIFVPAAKREWGYYVYPLLEGVRFVGRIELTAAGIRWTDKRFDRVDAELTRFARLAGLTFSGATADVS